MAFTDKPLTCVECGNEFVFTAGEQEFHASKGFTNEPRRCVTCRRARRGVTADAPNGAVAAGIRPMSGPARGERFEARRDSGPRGARRGERRGRDDQGAPGDGQSVMPPAQATDATPKVWTAICAACRGDAVLTHEPAGSAVLCSSCYDKLYAPAGTA